jgi:hypothetical protein
MRGTLAPLSPQEETALRKVGFGSAGPPADPDHIHRLLQVRLIEWNGWRWQLTPVGRQHYDSLVTNKARPSAA